MTSRRRLVLPAGIFLAIAAVMPCFSQNAPKAYPHNYKPTFTVVPLQPGDQMSPDVMQSQSASGSTIAFWSYSVNSPLDGKNYVGTMVGRSPFFNGHRTTVIPTYIVPVLLTFADSGTTFDPTVSDNCLGDSVVNVELASPLFQNVDYVMNGANVGSTQYTDAFQRANFWSHVSSTPYHTLFGGRVLSGVSVTVPAANGITNVAASGCVYGTMDLTWWEGYLRSTILPQLRSQGYGTTTFPIFLFDSVFEYQNGDSTQCCVLGYHSAYQVNGVLQTYSISSYDTSGAFGGDVSTTSHELAEWLDDPATNNPTPAWGHVGQVSGCQNNLEVGDPLSPGYTSPTNPFTVTTANGNTYTLQELANFSWFFRQSPSIASGGLYSNNGTFTSAQSACQ